MFLSKSVGLTLASFVAVFLLIALPGFAKIDPANIMGMWLFNEGKGLVLLPIHQNRGTMVKSTARSGLMGSLAKHLNLMVQATGLKFHTQTPSGLKQVSRSRSPFISKAPRSLARLLAKTTRIRHRRSRGTCSGTEVPIIR